MTVYATRLANGSDTRDRLRRADAASFFPAGVGLARGGLRNDGGGAVTVDAGTMNVAVAPFTAWVDGGASDLQGGYLFVSDTSVSLAVAPGHASLSRTDVVIAEVRDTTHDASGSTDARVRVLQGTAGSGVPVLPTNALALRNITVPAGLSAGTGGLASGNLSADRRTYTTGLGGILPVASQTERDALGALPGTVVYRTDTAAYEGRTASGWDVLQIGAADAALGFGTFCANAGSSRVYRRGQTGHLNLDIAVAGGTVPATGAVAVVPAGFRPTAPWRGVLTNATTTAPVPCRIDPADGLVVVDAAVAGNATLYGSLSYPTS